MQAASSHLFVPELGNFQTDGVLEPGRHDPSVTPTRIRGRLLEAQQRWDASASQVLDLRQNDAWVECAENLHVKPAIFCLSH